MNSNLFKFLSCDILTCAGRSAITSASITLIGYYARYRRLGNTVCIMPAKMVIMQFRSGA